jgi:hypothetical protein
MTIKESRRRKLRDRLNSNSYKRSKREQGLRKRGRRGSKRRGRGKKEKIGKEKREN